jgi:ribosomal protein S18 acetylase RimI-like enzyme
MTTFRVAIETDVATITDLVNSAYRGDSSKQGWTTEADFLDGARTDHKHVKELIDLSESEIHLAFDNNVLVACVHVQKENPQTLYFGMLTVKPGMQALGLGKEMLLQVDEVAKKWECTQIRITVIHLRAELIEYYERRGFMATGRIEKFPENAEVFGFQKVPLMLLEFVKQVR